MIVKKLNTFTCGLIACISSLSASSQGIKITPGANLVINNAGSLVINDGALVNDGTLTAGTGTVVISGTANVGNTSIGGTSPINLYNLTLNKAAGNAKLLNNVSVANQLQMTAGNLDLNAYNIDLGTTGMINGESPSSEVMTTSTGYINKVANLNAPNGVNVGNMGLELTSASNLGSTTIRRGHKQQVTVSGFSILRYYDVIPQFNSALNATAKLFYLDTELAGINENELKQWTSTNNGATWSLIGADAQDATLNYVTKGGINSFGRITLASSSNMPLPLQLISFTGQLVSNAVILKWSTAFQYNLDHFELQRSTDGRSFSSITNVAAVNSNTTSSYSYTDNTPFTGVQFYRLKTVEADGTVKYSQIVSVNKGLYINELISVYPNPTNGPLAISFTSKSATNVTLQLMDINGKMVWSKEVNVQKGFNEVNYNLSSVANGVYFLKVPAIDNRTIKIFKD